MIYHAQASSVGHLINLGGLKAVSFGCRLTHRELSRLLLREFGITKLMLNYLQGSLNPRQLFRLFGSVALLRNSNAHLNFAAFLACFRKSITYGMKVGNAHYPEQILFRPASEQYSPYHRFAGKISMLTKTFSRHALHTWKKYKVKRRSRHVLPSPLAVSAHNEREDEFLAIYQELADPFVRKEFPFGLSQGVHEIRDSSFASAVEVGKFSIPAGGVPTASLSKKARRRRNKGVPLPRNFPPSVDSKGNVRNTYTGCFIGVCRTLNCQKLEHASAESRLARIRTDWASSYYDNVPHKICNDLGISERDVQRMLAYAERISFPARDLKFSHLCCFLNIDIGLNYAMHDPGNPFVPKHQDEIYHVDKDRGPVYGMHPRV